MTAGALAAWTAGSYLLGSVSFSYLLVHMLRGTDLRRTGSGNLGATNAGRLLGRRWGLVVFLLDFAKGLVPVLLARSVAGYGPVLLDTVTLPLVAGVAAVLGHCFPFYLGFRGGKGVATASGALLGLVPLAALAGAAVFCVTVGLTRLVSLGSCLAALAVPVAWLALGGAETLSEPEGRCMLVVLAGLSLLVLARHRSNIKRILQGTEDRIGDPVDGGAEP